MTWKPDIVLYHSPCDDGFAAAFAAWHRWGDTVDYIPATYGRAPVDMTDKNVLIVDFSYKRADLQAASFTAKSIVILDHHKTAQADLEPFWFRESSPGAISANDIDGMLRDLSELNRPAIIALFDMDRSGARMTWDFCHPTAKVPDLIRFVEDRDLWRFDYPQTRAFSLWLRSHAYDFLTWNRIMQQLEKATAADIMRQAIAIEAFYNQKIDEMVTTARWLPINNVPVPVVNASWAFASDVAHALLRANPAAPFAATYYDRGDGSRTYSLRSDDDRDDVSVHAKRYGGGGHRNAAGFEVPAI
jgi:oligoribonuclease NrnB/cAMP/cGMP phosphodiesterase (DHH superfamily)